MRGYGHAAGLVLLGCVMVQGAERAVLKTEAATALRRAVSYFRENVATEGGTSGGTVKT